MGDDDEDEVCRTCGPGFDDEDIEEEKEE